MSLIDIEQERHSHPVDVIEQIAALNDWTFERAGDDEITISIVGRLVRTTTSPSRGWRSARRSISPAPST